MDFSVESITAALFNSAPLFPPAMSFPNFDCHDLYHWVQENRYKSPAIACSFYFLMVFVILPLVRPMKEKVPGYMKHLFAVWNLMFSVFSCYGVSVCMPFVMRVWRERGFRYLVCSDVMMLGEDKRDTTVACYGPIGFMMSLFMLSKFPELMDTFFLVLMNKHVPFLHWYHHVTVLLYSWFAYKNATPTAVMFGTVNFSVHAVMYFYFFATTYTRALNFLRMPITSIQLSQMLFGVFVCGQAYSFSSENCSRTYADSGFFIFCTSIYASYAVLFAKLFVDNYIFSNGEKKRKIRAKKSN